MKKLTAMLAMLLSVSILLCACGSKADGGDTADNGDSGEGDKILVGMVTDMAIDQAEWLQNLVAGVDEYNKSNEYNVEFKVIEATDVSEYEPKLRALAESGYSVIMGMYSAMVDPILAVAADYPDIKFGSLDGNIENIADYENVGEFGLDRLQTGFLAGCAAALMSESGLVGIAGGADIILLPEQPYDIDRVCDAVERRARKGSNFSIIAVAEGAINTEEAKMKRKEWMAKRAEAGYGVTATNRIAAAVQKKTGMETRVCIPGHMQRGGSPSAYDRVLATEFGSYAAKLVEVERYGVTVAMVNNRVVANRLEDIAGKTRNVPEGCELLTVARRMGVSLG